MDMDVSKVTLNGDSVISVNGTGTGQAPKGLKTMPKAVPPESSEEFPVTYDGKTCPQERGPIAGVYLEASAQPLGFYEAIQRGLLPAKVGLALLEAQAATGGLIDPIQGQLLPVTEAVKQGLVGLELKEKLLTAERALTGYPDPYGPGKLPLFQALHKEVVARDSGLSWLEAQLATGGIIDPAQGGRVSLELAYQKGLLDEETGHSLSDPAADGPRAFSDPNTKEPLTYQELRSRCVLSPATGLALLPLKITFPSLGGMVSSEQLLEAGILPRKVFEELREGKLLVPEVRAREEVQCYLEGTGSIVGVIVPPTGQRRSIYQALMEHLLPPGTALALLQAQAATYSLMDPASEKKLGLDEAVRAGLVGPEFREKLLVAERAVTGYPDPFSRGLIPLFQAMKKGLVPKELALRLLEAQLATGGIIDPVRKLRLPLETAFQWDCLDKETFASLSHPTGFFDPNTQENLTYEQLLVRCVTDPETGSLLLPLCGGDDKGHPEGRWFIDRSTQEALRKATAVATAGKFKGQRVSLWKLLFLDVIPAEQRAALAGQYQEGALSTEMLASQLGAIIDQAAAASRVTFEGLRDHVTPRELLRSEIINQDLYEKLEQGQTTAQDVGGLDSVRKYLQGTGCISGLLLPDSQEKVSIYEARRKGYLRPGTSLILLEAQAATGFIIDPKENKRHSVEEALRAGVIGPDVYEKLLSAERAVTGYTDPCTGDRLSLFQAMNKELIVREHGVRLLEAQIATGGIIDPVHSHRVPVEVAYKRGYFDRTMNLILSDPSDDTKGFFDPNTHENLTYLQLLEKCVTEPATGLCLLPLNSRKPQLVTEATRQAFQKSLLLVKYGRFKGQRVSVWDLINSEYFREGQRREILTHYKLRKITLEQIVRRLEEEMKKWAGVTLPALRGRVTAYQLLESRIIDRDLLEQVLDGRVSPEELLKVESVRRYLHGSGTIGGVLLQPSNQRLSLYEAMKQKLLVPGVALPLLEAQAATGSIIDPVSNEKLSVDDAVRKGLVGPELHEKLHHAEEAVTGFTDPFTGKKVSLFQAMKKGLVPSQQAVQLLEAQVATGGIIDPNSHHHVPMAVAAQRGYIDEEMEKTLSGACPATLQTFSTVDGSESLSYAQLLEHCQQDEASGCHLLPLPQTAAPVSTDEQIQQVFQDTLVAERSVSLWDLLCSGHFTDDQREAFLENFRLGRMTVQEIMAAALKQVREAELQAQTHIMLPGLRGEVPAVWLLDTGIIDLDTLEKLVQGTQSPSEVAQRPEVKQYLQGTGCIAGVQVEGSKVKMSIYQAMKSNLLPRGLGLRLLEAQLAAGLLVDPENNRKLSVEDAVKAGVIGGELSEQLIQAERAATGYTDPYTGGTISVWQAMGKGLIDQNEGFLLLQVQLATGGVVDPIHHLHLPLPAACRLGFLDEETDQALAKTTEDKRFFFDPNTRDKVTYQELKDRCILDSDTGLWLLPLSQSVALDVDDHTIMALKAMTVPVKVGRFKGQTVSLWDLLHSEYVSADKQKELVDLGRSGRAAALRQVVTDVTALIEETEQKARQITFPGLRKQVSANDLFRSQLIDKKTLDDLNQGKKTVHEVTEMEGVKKFLEGTNFIAGVLIQGTKERLSIYDAMRRHILRPGTALVLLEAQAATGFIINPLQNQRLSVNEAVAAGLLGGELQEDLQNSEKAVTGYQDPDTGERISLYKAMKKALVEKEEAMRMLEAQVATGGVIDPNYGHRLPIDVACKRGCLDPETYNLLSNTKHGSRRFQDPNTHEKVNYAELHSRCMKDPKTGLALLPIVKHEKTYRYMDEVIEKALKAEMVTVEKGKYRGQKMSVWDLLCSEYVTEEKKQELVNRYREDTSKALESIVNIIWELIEEKENKRKEVWFQGLRRQVTAGELYKADIINKDTLQELEKGQKQVKEIAERVKKYLEGTSCIAGVLVPSKEDPAKQEKMSIYQAMWKGILRPGTALVLLEAQAATGFIIDPVQNKKLSVDQALPAGLIGREVYEKLLSAEKAVTGYTEPYTNKQISLFEAMNKGLILKSHAIRLLEAQIATGGIIDPVHSHRVPVEVAYQRGYFDEEMNQILSDPSDDTKGFFDPNTHENLTYLQLLERCIQESETGLYMLQIVQKGESYIYIDETTKQLLRSRTTKVPIGKFANQIVSVWDLLSSQYFTQQKKRDLVRQFRSNTLHLDQLLEIIITTIEETEKQNQAIKVKGLRGDVTAAELFNSEIIDEKVLAGLPKGKRAAEKLSQLESVKRYMEGTGCIAGVLIPSTKEKLSVYEAMNREVMPKLIGMQLLQAQAATGFIINPLQNQRLSVNEAVAAGLLGGELQEDLQNSEKAVTGYQDPDTGERISLYKAMKKALVEKEEAMRMLEAQVATGGVIDPNYGHRLPIDVACKRGCLDPETYNLLSNTKHGSRRFQDPNTHEKVNYAELHSRCMKDPKTGLALLPIVKHEKTYRYMDEVIEKALKAEMVTVEKGKYRGQKMSVWDLLCSEYVTEEKKQELVNRYREDTSKALESIVNIIWELIEEKENKRKEVWFQGLRRQVTAGELYKADIINKDTLQELEKGQKQVKEIAERVKKYLEGTSCIAGVLVPSKEDPAKQEKMSIYQAMWKGILRPGTALVLLEAQAATGFVIDPLRNQKLSVDEAVAAGVVGGEIQEKLLSAERAVTGYTDPYSGEQISLFQAMKRDLIVKDHGVRLLEAQIATGGVIDPVHSHRVPVEVAYQRGYFDEEMNQILSDPSDDTKGFFDPNTHENLTYMQLLRRCVRDPDTGLFMLQLADKSSAVSQLSEQMRRALQDAWVTVHGGLFRGQTVSVWELLFCRDVAESKRQALLRKYRAGALTIEELTSTLTSLVTEAGDRRDAPTASSGELSSRRDGLHPRSKLQAATMEVEVGHLKGRKVPVWDVLVSTYVTQVTREDLLAQYDSGALPLPALTRRLTTIIEEAEGGSQEAEAREEAENARRRREEALGALRNTTMEVKVGQFQGQKVSVWEVLFSTYLTDARREELLAQHASGALTLPALIATLTSIIEETEEKLSKVSFRGLRRQVSASELRTSNILGLDTLRELAQGTKSLQEITEMDSVKRYLEGTSCIAGVLVPSKEDPAKQEKMSIYQAMWKGILRPGTALVLLEAQAATGFVIDPLRNQKLSVDEAVAAGVVGGEIQEKLLSAERAVTGYTDPYSGEQISLFQAMKRDLIVKDHGVRLLEAQIATGGVIDPVHSHRVPVEVAYQRGYFDEEMNQILSDPSDDTKGFFDPNTHENLTYMQLLRRCVRDPDTGLFMLQLADKSSAVSQLSEQMRRALQDAWVTVHGGLFRGQTVSVWELLFCRDVAESKRQALLRKYRAGALTIEELTSTLTSLVTEAGDRRDAPTASSGELSSRRDGLHPRSKLQAATMEVEVGHLKGRKVPVWDVLVSTYVTQVTREDLLAQYDSGALPLPALTRRLTTIIEEAEGGSQEAEAREEAENARRRREEALGALRNTTMEVKVGQFLGQKVSVWEVLFSTYLTDARREELLAQHASGALTLPALIATLTSIIEETEEKLSKVSFRGLRRQVSASELRTSNILGLDTLRELAQGTKSLQEITEMDSVKRYLEGTSCIAGVLVPSKEDPAKQEKMSIYQAMWKGILRPGTALVLLEAQAATGFVIDPLRNQKLSVDEAVAAGVVGGEIQEKLLSAERAVTGYTDPYSGEQISLFQAMKRDLIVKDHGVRLLEAQIATGGVIDPVHSHRVPVEVAYQRGYFDEEMNQILSDPSDDTKGFFDPNTHENLTYMQLLRRCVRDPDTGLFMLQLADKSSAVSQLSEQMRRALQDAWVTVHGGLFRGQTVSVWELLFCRDVAESKRQALLRKYRAGALTIEELTSTLTSLVTEAGDRRDAPTASSGELSSRRDGLHPRSKLQAATMEVEVGHLKGRKVPVWDVLVSTYVTQVTREDLLAQYDSGALPLPALTRRLTTIIEEAEGGSQEAEAREEAENARRRREEALGALRNTTMEVKVGQFQGQKVSVWEVLFSTYLTDARREELLAQHASGALTLPALIATLTSIIEETEEKLSKVSFRGLRRQVSASELRTSNILGLDTLRELAQGTKSLQEITEMDSVKRYLEGTSCIAGVLVPSKEDPAKQEKMSIYQAMWKGILRPGTALVLLEAQAATGFVIDPLRNQKLSVDEAVAAGVVGGEIQEKLLSAERAVTGYTDPYSGEQISLFQAMKRDLIVKDHGVRLLEAQIATGGVIDPVHSHRVPVEVAYQRGYFDEEMNQILSDPSDDTKGFFDPNTHENLTYMQLLQRCSLDPDSGLLFLSLK
ncbi:LOW QUALITY PROTEIN: epiplakin [Antechinus flavipes]|uniref:LOW QUALITY PROTEIN: epiplakin n=1 Tax=Antechinus flavipes TaxID=38775 RepID=UPI0022360615|nr:LOW QUALITY PROTEIN: epiplakin [Antechinus flavipes]